MIRILNDYIYSGIELFLELKFFKGEENVRVEAFLDIIIYKGHESWFIARNIGLSWKMFSVKNLVLITSFGVNKFEASCNNELEKYIQLDAQGINLESNSF